MKIIEVITNIPKVWKSILGIFIMLLVFFFLGYALYNNWQDVKIHMENIKFNIGYLVISFIFLFIYFVIASMVWKLVLKELNAELPLKRAIQIQAVTLLGRYVPGKFMVPLGKIYFTKKMGISARKTAISILFYDVYGIFSSLILFSISLLFLSNKELPKWIYMGLILLPICLIALHPKVHPKIVNFGLKVLKRDPISFSFSYYQSFKIMLLYAVCWITLGASFFLLIKSYDPTLAFSIFPSIIGIQSIAFVIGYISIFVPGGIGVREGVLALLLSFYMSLSAAILAAIIYRIWTILGQVILAAIFARGLTKAVKNI
ncbi:flippase-like domain-containing protein [bacterium]|nr:flippase-like domain-containing protein [bacterium]